MKSYTKSEVSNFSGLTPRMVQYYVDEGLVIPDVSNPSGRGHVRRFSFNNILECAIISNIYKLGVVTKTILSILSVLKLKLDISDAYRRHIASVIKRNTFVCIHNDSAHKKPDSDDVVLNIFFDDARVCEIALVSTNLVLNLSYIFNLVDIRIYREGTIGQERRHNEKPQE